MNGTRKRRKTVEAMIPEDTTDQRLFEDCIGACVKRDPLSPACMIQGSAGVCTPQVVRTFLQGVGDRPILARERFSKRKKSAPLDYLASTGRRITPYSYRKCLIPAVYAPRVEFARWFCSSYSAA
ncbi:hypothetical protein AVEN_170205-1 [Araneus ventricosus]|uniref:Uncharacterized protein n=1 Tax=Araneus ventricosus TaxID=182803 RepID=A0A4Y2P3H2_ARAVE|nr:hypothetical protein AVEN_170205-1 [Araneus ventricosus]